MGATALVISDIKDNSEIFSTTGVEEFIVDGVIVLYMIKDPSHPYQYRRAISVRKMRATHHPLDYFDFSIGSNGVSVGGSSMVELPGRKAVKPKPKSRKKEPRQKKNSMIDIGTLKARGGHSWRWKHL
jgi:KaiC/GvpD/RAD55 family RecA-like ATPase